MKQVHEISNKGKWHTCSCGSVFNNNTDAHEHAANAREEQRRKSAAANILLPRKGGNK